MTPSSSPFTPGQRTTASPSGLQQFTPTPGTARQSPAKHDTTPGANLPKPPPYTTGIPDPFAQFRQPDSVKTDIPADQEENVGDSESEQEDSLAVNGNEVAVQVAQSAQTAFFVMQITAPSHEDNTYLAFLRAEQRRREASELLDSQRAKIHDLRLKAKISVQHILVPQWGRYWWHPTVERKKTTGAASGGGDDVTLRTRIGTADLADGVDGYDDEETPKPKRKRGPRQKADEVKEEDGSKKDIGDGEVEDTAAESTETGG